MRVRLALAARVVLVRRVLLYNNVFRPYTGAFSRRGGAAEEVIPSERPEEKKSRVGIGMKRDRHATTV